MSMDSGSYSVILLTSLSLGLFSGAVMHRSDYCIAGMFRDLFLFKNTFMIRTLVLLVSAGMVLFESARQMGFLPLYPFPLLYSPTPANLLGGFLFGIGMVLAGGCVVGTLYKMGAGSLISALAFVGLIIGSALYAEIHPFWAEFIRDTTFLNGKITVSQVLGIDPLFLVAFAVFFGLFFISRWRTKGQLLRPSHAEGYLQPWKAALLLAVAGLFSYVLIGMPLGVTSSYAKLAAYSEHIFFRNHLEGLSYFKALPLKYVHPLTRDYLEGGAGPRFDAIAAIQFPLVIGIVLGSALSAIRLREFKIYFRLPLRQYASALAGGIIMGLASRLAPTCNVWHLLGGLPIFAVSSILFLVGLFPGAWVGNKILVSKVMKR